MRCRKELTLLLRYVALVVSIVVSVIVFPLRETVCTYVPARARLISSLSSSSVPGRAPGSFLTKSRRSRAVGPFLCGAGFAVSGLAAGGAGFVGIVFVLLFLFLATVAQVGVGVGCDRVA